MGRPDSILVQFGQTGRRVECQLVRISFRLRFKSTAGYLQATLSQLLTYCVLRPTQPRTISGAVSE